MAKSLTLTIVIPVYNEENYLKKCLDAIARQTDMPDEVIVVDNNCTDTSMEIAGSYPFVKIISEKQQGIVHARNRGFDDASSELIGRIDADTCLHPGWVAEVKKNAATMDASDAMTGPCQFYDSSYPRTIFAVHRFIYFWASRFAFGHTILFGSNMFFYKKRWREVRAEVCCSNAIHEDMDLASHIVSLGGKIIFNSKLPASASSRRFGNWRYYPTKWARTWMAHGLLPARYKSVHQIYESEE